MGDDTVTEALKKAKRIEKKSIVSDEELEEENKKFEELDDDAYEMIKD